MSSRLRWSLLLSLLAGSAALAIFDRPWPANTVAIVPATDIRPPAKTLAIATKPGNAESLSLPESEILELLPRTPGEDKGLAFSSRDWTPPPPPPPPSPPVQPTAPPLPFSYIGQQRESGIWQVFLSGNGGTRVVRQGEIIDGTYRVDAIAPPLMTLTYLPLNQTQHLRIGQTP